MRKIGLFIFLFASTLGEVGAQGTYSNIAGYWRIWADSLYSDVILNITPSGRVYYRDSKGEEITTRRVGTIRTNYFDPRLATFEALPDETLRNWLKRNRLRAGAKLVLVNRAGQIHLLSKEDSRDHLVLLRVGAQEEQGIKEGQSATSEALLSSYETFSRYVAHWRYACSDLEAFYVSSLSGEQATQQLKTYFPQYVYRGLKALEQINGDFVLDRLEANLTTPLLVKCFERGIEAIEKEKGHINFGVMGYFQRNSEYGAPLIVTRFVTGTMSVIDPASDTFRNARDRAEPMYFRAGNVNFHEFLHYLGFDNQTRETHNSGGNELDGVYACAAQPFPDSGGIRRLNENQFWRNTQIACQTCALLREGAGGGVSLSTSISDVSRAKEICASVDDTKFFVADGNF